MKHKLFATLSAYWQPQMFTQQNAQRYCVNTENMSDGIFFDRIAVGLGGQQSKMLVTGVAGVNNCSV